MQGQAILRRPSMQGRQVRESILTQEKNLDMYTCKCKPSYPALVCRAGRYASESSHMKRTEMVMHASASLPTPPQYSVQASTRVNHHTSKELSVYMEQNTAIYIYIQGRRQLCATAEMSAV